ncbi:hypothetical protein ACFXTI_014461 [Malus domestica]
MAGWSSLTTGFVLDCVETTDTCQKDGVFPETNDVGSVKDGVDSDEGDQKGRLRCIFHQVLAVFLKEVGDRDGVVRPVPAVIDDRQPVDLFKLFCVVKDRGGYDLVSNNSLWSFVAVELGVDPEVMCSVKLIYFKYLNELEKWFTEICGTRSLGNGESGCKGNLHPLSLELEREFRGLLSGWPEQKGKSDGEVHLESGECNGDDDEKVCNDDQNDVMISLSSLNKNENDRKRKRESLVGMLNWVGQIAKQPNDPSIGAIPEPTKWKEHRSDDECWVQAISAKEALLIRRNVNSKTEEYLQQKKLKTHPLLFEDDIVAGRQCSGRLRCSERLPHSVKSRSCPCCHKKEVENDSVEQAPAEVDLLATDTASEDNPHEKDVSVGAHAQADVPEWTGVASESDGKWLGTRVWPLKREEDSLPNETDAIGQGRQDSCCCGFPDSVACFRFHITEAKMKLKRELGSLFYNWRFDRMGEEVSLRWTAEEEKRFKDLVKSNHSNSPFIEGNNSNSSSFWDSASKWFPRKTREDLVTYYFNVFLVQRRSYQNRVTPKHIDSDDDVTELGSLSNGFRREVVELSTNSLPCSLNQKSPDFD